MKNILVIDDDPAAGQLIVSVIETIGHHVEYERSAEKALARIARPPRPDILVLDLFMPESDGYETMRALAQKLPEGIPTILISANNIDFLEIAQNFARSIGWPILQVLQKPITTEKMRACLASLPEQPA